jgi:hypothetical protein
MCVRKCAVALAASLTVSSFALAINPNAKPTAGFYDEQTVAANKGDFDATGTSFSEARFAARVRDGYLNNTGGVIDGAFFSELYSFGTSNSKVFDIIWNDNLLFTPAVNTASPISGLTAFGTGSKNVSIDIQPLLEGGAVGEKTVEVGLTALSQNSANFGAVTVSALLDNNQLVTATRNISEPLGQGDTFFGLRAPAGRYIKGINISHNHPTSTRIYFDDVAFRTAVVAPFRAEKLPAVDVAAESNAGGAYAIGDGSSTINIRDIGGTKRLAVMEFNVTDIGSDIVNALLELEVTAASGGANTLSVLGYAGDGTVSPADAAQAGTLLATKTIEGSGLLAITLNPTAVKNLMGSSTHLGLILSESSGSETTISTNDSTSAALKPTLTINYSAVPEPGTALGLLGVGVLTLSRRRRAV